MIGAFTPDSPPSPAEMGHQGGEASHPRWVPGLGLDPGLAAARGEALTELSQDEDAAPVGAGGCGAHPHLHGP